jgi:hypothetical protein
MPSFLRFDALGLVDILSGILVFFTVSFVPTSIAHVHTAVLIFKGSGGMIRPVRLPFPVYVIGGMADVLSAAILYTGNPPFLAAYKGWLAGILLLKGFWSLFGLMQKY